MEERMSQLLSLEEDMFITRFHQQVQKEREKAWHGRHIKQNKFQIGDFVLKFVKFLGKSKTHWLGPCVIKYIIDGGEMQLEKLNG